MNGTYNYSEVHFKNCLKVFYQAKTLQNVHTQSFIPAINNTQKDKMQCNSASNSNNLQPLVLMQQTVPSNGRNTCFLTNQNCKVEEVEKVQHQGHNV